LDEINLKTVPHKLNNRVEFTPGAQPGGGGI